MPRKKSQELAIKEYKVSQLIDGKRPKFYIQTKTVTGEDVPLDQLPKFGTFAGLRTAAYRGKIPYVRLGHLAAMHDCSPAPDPFDRRRPPVTQRPPKQPHLKPPTAEQLFALLDQKARAHFQHVSEMSTDWTPEGALIARIRDMYLEVHQRLMGDDEILKWVATETRRLRTDYNTYVYSLLQRHPSTRLDLVDPEPLDREDNSRVIESFID